tara:strand:+ start:90 stop:281 length:192 start_codon:yes stop_codon:yes gene_type:complete
MAPAKPRRFSISIKFAYPRSDLIEVEMLALIQRMKSGKIGRTFAMSGMGFGLASRRLVRQARG